MLIKNQDLKFFKLIQGSLKIFFSFILFLFFISELSFGQLLVQKFDGIDFNVSGNNSYAPFNGGHNNPRYQFVDIDADSDLDLFMFDADTSLYYYRNTGTPQNAQYKLISTRFKDLHFENWFYFADMDADGDYDLFSGGPFQVIKYYKNTGTPQNAEFVLMIEELHTNSDTVIYSEANCVPILRDLDGDGDLDFFTGQSLGTVTYYENIGNQNNFTFKYITDFWQNLLIISPALSNLHGANSLEFVDIDGDLDFDLFWGDLFSKGIYFIRNNGTPQNPNVAIIDSTYPHTTPFVSKGFNSTRFVDIDADGDKDLFISVLYLSENSNNFAFYRNNGNQFTPNFQLETRDYLRNVDVGGTSNISFTDIDADGDKDLFIGSDYARIAFYKNTGSASYPSFNLISDSIPVQSTSFNYAPAFADLDNDGDKDMILGSYIRDSLWLYRNNGTPQEFNFQLESRGYQIGITTLNQSSTPALVDIDNDGDQDLFIGGTNGRIFFYRNNGSPSVFNFSMVTNYFENIDVGDESVPRFYDFDNDGDFDLFIGKQDGSISFYRNEGTASQPSFVFQTSAYKDINVHQSSCPAFVDIDNDTDNDLFIGNVKGGIFYFRNDDIVGIHNISSETPSSFELYQNYPNPFNPSTVIRFDLLNSSDVSLKIYDITGKEVGELFSGKLNSGRYEYVWNAEGFPSGMYFGKLSSNGKSSHIKMLYMK